MNIAHISPHLGGGVGRVLLNYLSSLQSRSTCFHKVFCLDYVNEQSLAIARRVGLSICGGVWAKDWILDEIEQADIVFVHWWNHPLLFNFLIRFRLPPCRMVMWSHVSGLKPPYVFTHKLLNYPDLFVFASPISYQADEIKGCPEEQREAFKVVWSTSGIDHVRDIKPKKHDGINVGYMGTVDYCKMHPDFLSMCSRIDTPNVNFIVCGGADEKKIEKESRNYNLKGRIRFTGKVDDITPYLEQFDVFGYPLAPYHYGTCDQVLAECMAAGVVPVVFNNPMESYMVKDGQTGIVAKNQDEYIRGVERLCLNSELRFQMSVNAKRYAIKTYSVRSMEKEWSDIYCELLKLPKTCKEWKMDMEREMIEAKDVFIESLGTHGQPFYDYCKAKTEAQRAQAIKKILDLKKVPLWCSKTRGTVHHYRTFFDNDEYLQEWSHLMRDNK